jgi:hypothetical protein
VPSGRWNGDEPLSEDEMLGRAFQKSQQTFARLERRRDILQHTYHYHDLREIQVWLQDSRRPQVWLQPDIPATAPPEAPNPPRRLRNHPWLHP